MNARGEYYPVQKIGESRSTDSSNRTALGLVFTHTFISLQNQPEERADSFTCAAPLS
jgi:hypothetical protein